MVNHAGGAEDTLHIGDGSFSIKLAILYYRIGIILLVFQKRKERLSIVPTIGICAIFASQSASIDDM